MCFKSQHWKVAFLTLRRYGFVLNCADCVLKRFIYEGNIYLLLSAKKKSCLTLTFSSAVYVTWACLVLQLFLPSSLLQGWSTPTTALYFLTELLYGLTSWSPLSAAGSGVIVPACQLHYLLTTAAVSPVLSLTVQMCSFFFYTDWNFALHVLRDKKQDINWIVGFFVRVWQ